MAKIIMLSELGLDGLPTDIHGREIDFQITPQVIGEVIWRLCVYTNGSSSEVDLLCYTTRFALIEPKDDPGNIWEVIINTHHFTPYSDEMDGMLQNLVKWCNEACEWYWALTLDDNDFEEKGVNGENVWDKAFSYLCEMFQTLIDIWPEGLLAIGCSLSLLKV